MLFSIIFRSQFTGGALIQSRIVSKQIQRRIVDGTPIPSQIVSKPIQSRIVGGTPTQAESFQSWFQVSSRMPSFKARSMVRRFQAKLLTILSQIVGTPIRSQFTDDDDTSIQFKAGSAMMLRFKASSQMILQLKARSLMMRRFKASSQMYWFKARLLMMLRTFFEGG